MPMNADITRPTKREHNEHRDAISQMGVAARANFGRKEPRDRKVRRKISETVRVSNYELEEAYYNPNTSSTQFQQLAQDTRDRTQRHLDRLVRTRNPFINESGLPD